MTNLQYFFTVSPEVILNKYRNVTYVSATTIVTGTSRICCSSVDITGQTLNLTASTKVNVSMRDILSGGTNGSSTLTGLTIPILLTQTDIDMGFYTPFDGNISQKETLNNFLISANTSSPFIYYVYNTSDRSLKKFLQQVNWKINWGDGSPIVDFTTDSIAHVYKPVKKTYTITLIQESPWGMYTIEKEIYTPYTDVVALNPKGSVNFYPQGGIWDSVKNPYDFIFTGDSNNSIQDQISSNYTTIPFIITGYTKSRLSELSQYGKDKYVAGQPIYVVSGNTISGGKLKPNLVEFGKVISITPQETKYEIQGITYSDFQNGPTIYMVKSSGITSNMISSSAITKDETLLRIVDKPQVWSDVFIERGKNSGQESVHRLGEVDNLGDLIKYGYRFFKVKS
jgi:hypothetical protein